MKSPTSYYLLMHGVNQGGLKLEGFAVVLKDHLEESVQKDVDGVNN